MKKVLLMLISVISLLAIACGASATKPEDLKDSAYESKTRVKTRYMPIAQNTPIYFNNIIDYPNLGSAVATDAKIIEVKSDNTQHEVTCNKDISSGYLYSITPTVAPVADSQYCISYNYKVMEGTGTIVEHEVIYDAASAGTAVTINKDGLKKGGILYKVEASVYNNSRSGSYSFSQTPYITTIDENGITLDSSMLSMLQDAEGKPYSPQINDKIKLKLYVY